MSRVFFDVDTQLDFLYPGGALYVPGAEEIVATLGKLTAHAAANGTLVISSVDAHSEDDPEFRVWKPHCVAGTAGQQKAANTLLSPAVVLRNEPDAFQNARDKLSGAAQIVVEKQHVDVFTNPNLLPLLDWTKADEFVVYGVVSEVCVRHAAYGLLDSGKRVTIVEDAIKSLNPDEEREMLAVLQAKGAVITRSNSL
jgi:nicotinamidase/pyrazinamidase